MYGYRPKDKDGDAGPWNLLLYDVELGFGTLDIPEAGSSYDVLSGNKDPILARLLSTNRFQRAYWRGFLDLVNDDNGAMRNSSILPIAEASHAALANNQVVNLSLATMQSVTNWINARKNSLRNALAGRRPQFEVTTASGQTTPLATFSVAGRAPVEVKSIELSNTVTTTVTLLDLKWTTASNWSSTISLNAGLNSLQFRGRDRSDKFLSPNDTGNFIDNWNITRE